HTRSEDSRDENPRTPSRRERRVGGFSADETFIAGLPESDGHNRKASHDLTRNPLPDQTKSRRANPAAFEFSTIVDLIVVNNHALHDLCGARAVVIDVHAR